MSHLADLYIHKFWWQKGIVCHYEVQIARGADVLGHRYPERICPADSVSCLE